MEFIPHNPNVAGVPLGNFVPPKKEAASFWEVAAAAFVQENDVANAFAYMLRPSYPSEEGFDILKRMDGDPLASLHGMQLARAQSNAEYEAIAARIQQEQRQKEILASAGFGGFVAASVAGLVSPTSLIPLVGPARGLKGAANSFALALAAAGGQEAALYATQETRTLEEVAIGVAAGTVLGGLLGTAARQMTPADRALLEGDMVGSPDKATILRTREDGATEELETTFEAIESPGVPVREPEVAAEVEFERSIKQVRAKSMDEEMSYGRRFTEAELPNGYKARFAKVPSGSGGAYFTGGEYAMTIVRQDGTIVDPPQRNARAPDIGLAGNTLIEKQKELKEAFLQGKLDKQIDRMLEAAGEAPLFTKAESVGESVGAARVREEGGIARAETRVGKAVDAGAARLAQIADTLPDTWAGRRAKGVLKGTAATVRAVNDPVGMLAKLNPVTRQLENKLFPASRAWAARLQIPGIKLKSGYAPDGDIVSRTNVHMQSVAKFIREYDIAYADYVTDGQGKDFVREAVAARHKALGTAPEGKLTYKEFGEEVFRLGNLGLEHDDPSIMRAVAAQQGYYDYVNGVAKTYFKDRQAIDPEAKPLYEELEFDEGDEIQGYVHHIFNPRVIQDNQVEFIQDFSSHGEKLLNSSFAKAYEKFDSRRSNLVTMRKLLGMDEAAITAHAENVRAIRDEIEVEFGAMLKQVKNLRKSLRAAGAEPEEIEAAVKDLESAFGPEYPLAMKQRRELDKELRVLDSVGAGLSEKQADLIEQLGKLEDTQMRELDILANAVTRFNDRLKRIGEKEARSDAELGKLYARAFKAAKEYLRQARQADKLAGSDDLTKADIATDRAETAGKRMEDILEKIDSRGVVDFESMRELARDGMKGVMSRTKRLNAARTIREERLKERIKEADPEVRAKWREEESARIDETLAQLEDDFDAQWRDRGATGNPTRGDANFAERALEDAQELYKNILGNPLRVSGVEVLGAKRGAELRRMLNIPLEVKAKYLETDPERVVRAHGHSMFPDLEMYRATGSVNGAPIFDELKLDYQREQAKIALLPKEEQADASWRLDDAYRQAQVDWSGMIQRLRHQRGVPSNPDGIGYRMGRVAMNLNVTRFMGMVAVSSLPDAARVTFRYGLTGAFKDAWRPMVDDLPRIKATRAEAERFGIALDPLLHNRAAAIFDIGENFATRQTMAERGLEFLANKTGFVAMFDRWTAEMKHIATNGAFSEMSHALRVLNSGEKFSAKEIAQAREMLQHVSIDAETARRIWTQYMKPDGSTEFKRGFRLPNTESWDDFGAVMAMRSAVNRIVNDLIVTPGLDRPLWMDQNIAFKLVAQFRSFTYTATNRILMAGLQEPDMVYLQGLMFSLALGAVSYYTWAVAAGGDAYEEAMQLDLDKWIYESMSRSGVLGVLGEVQRVGEQIPGLNDSALFGANYGRTQRAGSLMGAVLGPSFDLAERMSRAVQDVGGATLGDDPLTASDLRNVRRMVPYQNVFYIRRLLDAVEGAMVDNLGIPDNRRTN